MSKRPNPEDVDSIRLRSRQAYLEKRQELKLAELRKQVQEEAEEERSNPRLSKRELAEFARNRELLKIAEQRLNIDDGREGYILPDSDGSKLEVLTSKKQKDASAYKSEVQLWEDEVTARAKGAQVQRPERVNETDYEFVFDQEQAVKFTTDVSVLDPDKRRLESMLEVAEQKARSIEEVKKSLPIFKYRDQLLEAIADHPALIVVGQTGSGKTTQLVQYLYEAGYCKDGRSICITQPRRVAAMSTAARVAEEMHVRLGDLVGYQIRFEDKTSPATRIHFLTEGILLRQLIADPTLSAYSCIILDEAHERSTNGDIIMAILKDLLRARTDLKCIISSATIDAEKMSKYMDGSPVFFVEGRTFGCEVHWTQNPEANYQQGAIATIWQIHLTQDPGDILVFLTGQEEIDSCQQILEDTRRKLGSRVPELVICPIYSTMPTELQNKIFEPAPTGARKCVIATNIAETSLTIDGIVYVIDCGFSKEMTYSAQTGMSSLQTQTISRANAEQRSGRAGRSRKGKAFRLYTKFSYYNEMEESPLPEIQRSNLISTVLLLKSLGVENLLEFDLLDPPSPEALCLALENLYALGALNDTGVLTSIGRKLAELPIDVQLARTILAANDLGCVHEVLIIASMLGESNNLFIKPRENRTAADVARSNFESKEGGDFLTLLNVFTAWESAEFSPMWARESFLQQRSLTRARDVRDQLEKLCERIQVEVSSCGTTDHVRIRKAFVAGFFNQSARLDRSGQSYRTIKSGNQTVYLHPSSALKSNPPRFIIYYELLYTSKEYARQIIPILPEWLSEMAPQAHKQKDIEKLGGDKKMPKGKGKTGIDGR
ncbi:P-loop containing nucleoside triphosphate hydrolase protein [Byssothecium circinans]|uniref:RNA helicase n=1 Tax=Byssothecium circinans TaxID=147558 RepID=A0A6A5UF13_9PLEO|nr:P-loop containing nucleoside triphosphate hydrolase protein [Byssothecium circinans]